MTRRPNGEHALTASAPLWHTQGFTLSANPLVHLGFAVLARALLYAR